MREVQASGKREVQASGKRVSRSARGVRYERNYCRSTVSQARSAYILRLCATRA